MHKKTDAYKKKQLADLREISVVVVPMLLSDTIIRALNGGQNLPFWQSLAATLSIVACVAVPYRLWRKYLQQPEAQPIRVEARRNEHNRNPRNR